MLNMYSEVSKSVLSLRIHIIISFPSFIGLYFFFFFFLSLGLESLLLSGSAAAHHRGGGADELKGRAFRLHAHH